MAKRIMFFVTVCCWALAGCAAPGPNEIVTERSPLKCTGQNRCWSKVGVKNCATRCDVAIQYDVMEILPNVRGDVSWELQDSAYEFPDNGIVINDGGEVFRCRHEQNRKRFVCANNHPQNPPGAGAKTYKYTVNLRGPLPVNPLDPFLVND